MKNWKKRFLNSYQDRLLLCFLGGVAAGTIIANLLSSELQSQIGYFDGYFWADQILSGAQKKQLYLYVLRQREAEILLAWFLTLTVFSKPGFCCLGAAAGGISAITISVLTGQCGLMGAALYLATLLPQWLLYAPVWLVLAVWAEKEEKKIRLPAIGLLLLVIAAGAAAEVYWNPYFLKLASMLFSVM